jgi:hypothetical protein
MCEHSQEEGRVEEGDWGVEAGGSTPDEGLNPVCGKFTSVKLIHRTYIRASAAYLRCNSVDGSVLGTCI